MHGISRGVSFAIVGGILCLLLIALFFNKFVRRIEVLNNNEAGASVIDENSMQSRFRSNGDEVPSGPARSDAPIDSNSLEDPAQSPNEQDQSVRVVFDGGTETPEELQAYALVGINVVALPSTDSSVLQVPVSASQLFLACKGGRPTLVPVGPDMDEVVVPRGRSLAVRVQEMEGKAPIANATVTLLPSVELAPQFQWIRDPLNRRLGKVTDADGRAILLDPFLHQPASGGDSPMTIRVSTGERSQVFSSRSLSPASPRPALLALHIAPLQLMVIELQDMQGPTDGASAEVWLAEGAGKFAAAVRADSILEIAVPVSEEIPYVDGVSVLTSTGSRLFIGQESLHPPSTTVAFNSKVIPVAGSVTGGDAHRDRIMVGTYPLSEDVEDEEIVRGAVEHALPFSEIAWTPVSADGQFMINEGWYGVETAVLAKDRLSGLCLGGARIRANRCDLKLGAWSTLRIQRNSGDSAAQEWIWLDTEGASGVGRIRIALAPEDPTIIDLPPGSYSVSMESGGIEYRVQSIVLSGGREADLRLPDVQIIEINLLVTGSIQGPLSRAVAHAGGGQVLTSTSEGRMRARIAVPSDGGRMIVKWPNPNYPDLAAIEERFAIGDPPTSIEFPEGTVEFRIPHSGAESDVGELRDIWLLVSKGGGPPALLPLPEALDHRIVLPEGIYHVTLLWTADSRQSRSSALQVSVVANRSSTVEFHEQD